jgi:hypothetical protein
MLKHLQYHRSPGWGFPLYLKRIQDGGNLPLFKTDIYHGTNYLGDNTCTGHVFTSLL